MSDRHICKAKRTDNGEWVEGYYCKRETGHYTGICFVEEYKDCIIQEAGDWGIDWCEVDSATVCKCTGLPDKNGKNIFEKDAVKVTEDFEEIYVIEWDEDMFSCRMKVQLPISMIFMLLTQRL